MEDLEIKEIGILSNRDVELMATQNGFHIKKFKSLFRWEQYDFTSEELEKLYLEHKKLIKNK